jgi:mannose-1-phosphate guanylyltransferase
MISKRPWGYFENVFKGNGFKIKKIVVFPGKRLSLQKHFFREETWLTFNGVGEATIGKTIKPLTSGAIVHIKKKQPHRLSNTGKQNLEIYEIQAGQKLVEYDIVRLEDDYGRK